ncbi:unnamed protein product [Pylaiella littoralis]
MLTVWGALIVAMAPALVNASSTTIRTTSRVGRAVRAQQQQQRQLGASSSSSMEHLGCFADSEGDDSEEGRALDHGFESVYMTPEVCATHCVNEGFDYMGLQFGYQCWCGSKGDEEQHTKYGPGTCDYPCLGDEDEFCGGYWAFDLFFVGAPGTLASTPSPAGEADVATPSDRQILLDLHNEARCMHGAEPLVWDESVEAASSAHAEFLTTPENCGSLSYTDADAHDFGENLFLCYGSADCMTAEGVLESYYETGVTEDGPVAEYEQHAKRMLWKSSAKLGCSISSCVSGSTDVEVLVCNYDPTGDYRNAQAVGEEVETASKTREECAQVPATTPPAPSTTTPPPAPESESESEPAAAPSAPPTSPVTTPTPTPSPVAAPSDPPTPAPVPATPSPVDPPTPEPVPATSSPVDPATAEPVQPEVSSSGGGGACDPSPCLNEGSCEVDPSGGYICTCSESYGGMHCETATAELPEFFITVEFLGTWTQGRKDVFQDAATRWAEVLTHIPCTGTSGNGRAAGELLITSTLEPIDGASGTLGFAGPSGIWGDCRGISYAGEMTFDIDDIAVLEQEGTFGGVILHEMGHVIGSGTLWGECSECDSSGSAAWKCPLAAEVYNDLAGNPAGTSADIIELDGGSGTRCGHFSEDKFENELMTGFVNAGVMPLSKLTCASLADGGYVVKADMVDAYTLPSLRAPSARVGNTTTYELAEGIDHHDIDVCDQNGTIIEVIGGKRFRF